LSAAINHVNVTGPSFLCVMTNGAGHPVGMMMALLLSPWTNTW
jgi:hypothetical protein